MNLPDAIDYLLFDGQYHRAAQLYCAFPVSLADIQ